MIGTVPGDAPGSSQNNERAGDGTVDPITNVLDTVTNLSLMDAISIFTATEVIGAVASLSEETGASASALA